MTWRALLPVLLLSAGLASWGAEARAQTTTVASAQQSAVQNTGPRERRGDRYTQLVLDGSFAGTVDDDAGYGGGAALRVGRAIPLSFLVLVPELGADVYTFGGSNRSTVYSGFGGARLRLAGLVEPGVFSHVAACGLKREDRHDARACLDVGLTVDVTFYERMLTGLQAQYKTVLEGGADRFHWYTLGASLGVKL